MSLISLVMNASFLVQLVMFSLLIASLLSWSIIFTKRQLVRNIKNACDDFEDSFWSGTDLNTLYRNAQRQNETGLGMIRIFEAGFREYNRLSSQTDIASDKLVDECRRSMRVAQLREIDRLEASLATLATIGSTSPYVG